jgi:hypothetical protein
MLEPHTLPSVPYCCYYYTPQGTHYDRVLLDFVQTLVVFLLLPLYLTVLPSGHTQAEAQFTSEPHSILPLALALASFSGLFRALARSRRLQVPLKHFANASRL